MKKKNFVNDLIIVGVYGSVKMFDKEEQKIYSSFGDRFKIVYFRIIYIMQKFGYDVVSKMDKSCGC